MEIKALSKNLNPDTAYALGKDQYAKYANQEMSINQWELESVLLTDLWTKGAAQNPFSQPVAYNDLELRKYDLDQDGKISKAEYDLAINRLARQIEMATQAMSLVSAAGEAQNNIIDTIVEET